MKQYVNVSKKLGAKRDDVRRKKEKTNHSHDLKHLRKEMKKIIEETPIFPKAKKKDGQKSTKSHQMNLNSKNLKSYSKSEELFSQPKTKRKTKLKSELKNREDFKEISFSMPMTSKIIHLFSNNSSVYNSQKDLETIHNGRSFVIPTEQSVEEISEIREF